MTADFTMSPYWCQQAASYYSEPNENCISRVTDCNFIFRSKSAPALVRTSSEKASQYTGALKPSLVKLTSPEPSQTEALVNNLLRSSHFI